MGPSMQINASSRCASIWVLTVFTTLIYLFGRPACSGGPPAPQCRTTCSRRTSSRTWRSSGARFSVKGIQGGREVMA